MDHMWETEKLSYVYRATGEEVPLWRIQAPVPASLPISIATVEDEALARHIVELHNASL
jgi:hypothetical protein